LLRRLVNFALGALYNQMAWTYDLVAWLVSFGQWKAWGRTALPYLQGQRILELAHGPGHLLVSMHQRGLQPTGLDLSPYMGRLAKSHLRKTDLNVPLVRARAQALPFRNSAFNSVVATFPTEFIIDPDTLQEVARVLGQNGRCVVVPGIVFRQHNKFNLPSRFLKWLYAVTGQSDSPPPQAWTAIADAGFSLSRIHQPMGMVDVLIVVAQKTHSV